MNFSINGNILLEKLNIVSKAVSSKNIIPILSGIKFDLTKSGLLLSAHDSEITIQNQIETDNIKEITKEGSIVIPGRYIVDIIRKSVNETIKIEILDGLKLLVKTDSYESKLNGMNPEDFPNLDLTLNKKPIVIKSKVLKNIINQTGFAASLSETRPVLTGINFVLTNNKLEVTATDSHRLAKKTIELSTNVDDNINIVIPSRNLYELKSILPDDDLDIELHIFENKILFYFDGITFQSKLISGNYPNTNKIIPESSSLVIDLNKEELFNALDRVSLISVENKVKLSTEKEYLIVSSGNVEIGHAEEKVKINKNDKEDIVITFNSKYMMESLKIFEGDNIELKLNGNTNPLLIKSVDDETIIQLLLPIITI